MSFRLVPNSVTLDDLERRNSPNRSVISVKLVCVTKFTYSQVDTKLPVNRFTLRTFNLTSSIGYPNVMTLGFRLIFSCLHYNYAVLCSMGRRSAPIISFSTPCFVFISEIVLARNFTRDGTIVNVNKANNCRYNPAAFMVLGGTAPPPHISGPALYCIFSTVNTVRAYVLRRRASTRGGIYALLYFIL